LALDWDGVGTPGADAPRVLFDATPAPPSGFKEWIPFLLQTEGTSPDLERLGTELHDLVIAGDIDAALRRARARGPYRLLLKVEPSDLDALPWELMRNDGMPLFTSTRMPVARVAPWFNREFTPPGMCWPLRVVLVVGSADEKIHVEDEINYIRDGFRKVCGLVDLEVIRLPKRADVRKIVGSMQPDVFHFIGHGDYND